MGDEALDVIGASEAVRQPADVHAAEFEVEDGITVGQGNVEELEQGPSDGQRRRRRRYVGRRQQQQLRENGPSDSSSVSDTASGTIALVSDAQRAKTVSRNNSKAGRGKVFRGLQIPADILQNDDLNQALEVLPWNYNFEVHKTLFKIRQVKATRVALQLPEGLLAYSCILADVLERFGDVETVIMGDVTYGACCVDDFTSTALGCDLLVHYGHSCLVPIDSCLSSVLYVFVDIKFDLQHFVDTIGANFPAETRLAIVSTIQFAASLHAARTGLESAFPNVLIPQARPLSKGEVLGCTSPRITVAAAVDSAIADRREDSEGPCAGVEALVYLGDGRFHLESIMISNPDLKTFRYDPYSKKFTRERYDTEQMHTMRRDAIAQTVKAQTIGIILGTLGRQGSPDILHRLTALVSRAQKTYVVLLLSEIFPQKLASMPDVDAWVQIACPRLSIDWGYAFDKPLLNPYEAEVALGAAEWQQIYPMDYYSQDGGPWSNYAHKNLS